MGGYAPAPPQVTSGAATTRLRKTNGIGYAGAVAGLGSFILNPLGLASIAAIVLCIIGLVADERMRNAGARVAGRGWIIAGLVVSVISLVLFAASALRLIGAFRFLAQ